MKLWMDVMRDLESVMNDHERILDAWAEGGVDGVVFGPLVFGTAQLSKRCRVRSHRRRRGRGVRSEPGSVRKTRS